MQFQLDEYDCQVCTESTVQNFCRVGDTVDIRISKFTKGQYTLESITVLAPAFPKRETHIPQIPPYTPIVKLPEGGNEPEMAMKIAAEFHSKRSHLPLVDAPTIEKDVIPDAEIILAWIYEQKRKTTKQ
jgi:hypothetical protein